MLFFKKNRVKSLKTRIKNDNNEIRQYLRLTKQLSSYSSTVVGSLRLETKQFVNICNNLLFDILKLVVYADIYGHTNRRVIIGWCGTYDISLLVSLLREAYNIDIQLYIPLIQRKLHNVIHMFHPIHLDPNRTSDNEKRSRWDLYLRWNTGNDYIELGKKYKIHEDIKGYYNMTFPPRTWKINNKDLIEWNSFLKRYSTNTNLSKAYKKKISNLTLIVLNKNSKNKKISGWDFAVKACLEYYYNGYITEYERFTEIEKREISRVAKKMNLITLYEFIKYN